MPYTPGTVLGPVQASIGAVTLGVVDAAGVAWTLGRLDGWDSADVRTQYSDRQADHGSWPGQAYLQARVLTLGGTVTADDQTQLEACLETLREAISLDDTLLTVYESVPKQCTARASGRLLIDRPSDRTAAFSALLTAADPRRYSTVLQTATTGLPDISGGFTLPITLPLTLTAAAASGQITLTNDGTIATRPTFTILGPVTTPSILVQYPDSTVRQLSYSDSLGAGDTLVIDTDAHSAVLNGTVSRRRYLSGDWPEIPPRATVTVQWSAPSYDPAATLTGSCRSAWK